MTNRERAAAYKAGGYYTNSTAEEIRADIERMNNETRQADKRTYNGRSTRIFNNSRISIANIILADMHEKRDKQYMCAAHSWTIDNVDFCVWLYHFPNARKNEYELYRNDELVADGKCPIDYTVKDIMRYHIRAEIA